MINCNFSPLTALTTRKPGVAACAFGDRTNFYAID